MKKPKTQSKPAADAKVVAAAPKPVAAATKPVAAAPKPAKPSAAKTSPGKAPPAKAAKAAKVAKASTALAVKGPPPAPAPIVAISLEGGVIVAVFTATDSPEPAEIRLAIEKPFLKVIAAPARKCHQASAVFRDEKAGVERRATVAFIPTPKGARTDGTVHYRAKRDRHETFFTVPTQRLESMNREQLTKLLYVLNTPFKTVLGAALPASHELAVEVARLEKLRASADAWARVQTQVREKLEAKDVGGALELLEPLVYTKTPLPAAEKLLGEMLLKMRPKGEEQTVDAETSPAVEALNTARLLLEYTIARAQLASG